MDIFQQSVHATLRDEQFVTSVNVPVPTGAMFAVTHVSARVVVPRGQYPQCLIHASTGEETGGNEDVQSVVLLQPQGLANISDHLYAANHPVLLYVDGGASVSVVFSRSQPATGSAILEVSLIGQRYQPVALRASA